MNTLCHLCEASPDMELDEVLSRLKNCVVCSRDVNTKGAITGVGASIFRCLLKKYGFEKVMRKWNEEVQNVADSS